MSKSPLATDAYKFSMGQAGFPLREEAFYLSFRRGGVQLVPFDLAQRVRELLGGLTFTDEEMAFARKHGYGATDAMVQALAGELEIDAVPAGAWVCEREPIVRVNGPSFLVSWLEPQLIWLNFSIQLATELKLGRATPQQLVATCDEHEALIRSVARAVGAPEPEVVREDEVYVQRVRNRVRELVAAVGDPQRIFEIGMRSAVCMQQHELALQACKAEGITQTSNLALARKLDMTPVGTMAHEHVQRWGADLPAFEAMRDMRTSAPSYLLDTFDTMGEGINAAIAVMRGKDHACSIRYDSGNKFVQYLHACELLREAKLRPGHVLADGLDVSTTEHFESLRAFTQLPAGLQVYGYGGSIVADTMTNPLTRDRVGAVFKLSQTGRRSCMKFGDEEGLGKQSIPGHPIVWRRLRGAGPVGIIAQVGEPVSDDYLPLRNDPEVTERLRLCNVLDLARAVGLPEDRLRIEVSPQTEALIERVLAKHPAAKGRAT